MAHDLRADASGPLGSGAAELRAAMGLPGGMALHAQETVDRQFLMHTVQVRLTATLPGPPAHGAATIAQRGWLRRTDVAATLDTRADARFARHLAALLACPAWRAALMELDLTYCAIEARGTRWTLRVVPFGGSEVVNRMPSFRRYIRVTDAQRHALAATFGGFAVLLAQCAGD
nr:DUF3156 family protein [Burkholderia alba]